MASALPGIVLLALIAIVWFVIATAAILSPVQESVEGQTTKSDNDIACNDTPAEKRVIEDATDRAADVTVMLTPPDGVNPPLATYPKWPAPTAAVCLLLGLAGSVAGSGGTAAGFGLALALNPVLWLSAYALFKVGKLRCPHCRATPVTVNARYAAVGTLLQCRTCKNWCAKPPAR